MSGAVGRRLLGNILHEGHSLSISQDFPWVKTSHLFFPVHECLMCIPGSFLLLMWQQERWHGWRGLTLDSVCAQLLSLVWLCDPMDCSLPGWSVHGDSLGKNNGVGLHALLQGIFPTQGLNWSLLHFRQVLYHLSQGWITEIYFQCYFCNLFCYLVQMTSYFLCSQLMKLWIF